MDSQMSLRISTRNTTTTNISNTCMYFNNKITFVLEFFMNLDFDEEEKTFS